MLTLSVSALTAVLVALANPANAAPIESHPAIQQRAVAPTIGATLSFPLTPESCLGVESLADGAGLFVKNCTINNPTSSPPFYNRWDIAPGNNQVVRLSGLPAGSGDFCLDAGDLSGSSRSSKIWTCFSGLPQQQWYYTDDKHIAITGGSGCLESGRYGTFYNQCASNSASGSQVWQIGADASGGDAGIPGDGNNGTTPTPTPPTGQGKPIKWLLNGEDKCLTVGNGYLANDAALTINDCFAPSSTFYAMQQFVYNAGSTKIRVAANNFTQTDYCVDFGSDRRVNGVGMKIWQCYDNLPAQQLWITGDNHIAVEGDNQCADVRTESQATQTKPYGSLKDLQSWECSGGNTNQIFEL